MYFRTRVGFVNIGFPPPAPPIAPAVPVEDTVMAGRGGVETGLLLLDVRMEGLVCGMGGDRLSRLMYKWLMSSSFYTNKGHGLV